MHPTGLGRTRQNIYGLQRQWIVAGIVPRQAIKSGVSQGQAEAAKKAAGELRGGPFEKGNRHALEKEEAKDK